MRGSSSRSLAAALLAMSLLGAAAPATARAAETTPAAVQPVINPMPAAPTARTLAAADAPVTSPVVSSVSKSPDTVDAFGVDAGQRIYHATRKASLDAWRRSAQLNGGVAAKGTSVYGVSRYTNRMDVFAVGTDRRVWTAFWEGANGAWNGWWQIGTLKVQPNSSVHAVTSHRDRMDLFAVGEDRKIYTITWTAQAEWGAWEALPGVTPGMDTTVFGISGARYTNSLDVFSTHVPNNDTPYHNVYTPETDTWSGWKRLSTTMMAAQGSSIMPVSRQWGTIDILVNYKHGGIYTANWDSVVGWSDFQWMATNARARGGTSIFATSKSNRTIDAVSVSSTGDVQVASMGVDRRWSPWRSLGGAVLDGTSVFIQGRGSENLDVFAVKPDFGTYTTSWNSVTGWKPAWEGVGPKGQAGTYKQAEAAVTIGGEVVGWSTLRISAGGAWTFKGGLHNNGIANRNVKFAWVVGVPSGQGFSVDIDEKINGSAGGGSTSYSWSQTGANNELAAAWPEIDQLSVWEWNASESIDASDLILQLVSVVGIIDHLTKLF